MRLGAVFVSPALALATLLGGCDPCKNNANGCGFGAAVATAPLWLGPLVAYSAVQSVTRHKWPTIAAAAPGAVQLVREIDFSPKLLRSIAVDDAGDVAGFGWLGAQALSVCLVGKACRASTFDRPQTGLFVGNTAVYALAQVWLDRYPDASDYDLSAYGEWTAGNGLKPLVPPGRWCHSHWFSPTGHLCLRAVGGGGSYRLMTTLEGRPAGPPGIIDIKPYLQPAISELGEVYVADPFNHSIERYSAANSEHLLQPDLRPKQILPLGSTNLVLALASASQHLCGGWTLQLLDHAHLRVIDQVAVSTPKNATCFTPNLQLASLDGQWALLYAAQRMVLYRIDGGHLRLVAMFSNLDGEGLSFSPSSTFLAVAGTDREHVAVFRLFRETTLAERKLPLSPRQH